jgi:hypothetical protein
LKKNILVILLLINLQPLFAAPQVNSQARTCAILDGDYSYRARLRENIWERRMDITDMRDEDLENSLAVWFAEIIEQTGYLPGLQGAKGEPKNFPQLKAQGLKILGPIYANVGMAFLNIEQLIKYSDASIIHISERMPRFYNALLLHEYVQRQILGRSATKTDEAAAYLLRAYIHFDGALSRMLR